MRFWITMLLVFVVTLPVRSQDLIQMYQQAQFKERAEKIFDTYGLRPEPRPPAVIPIQSEDIRYTLRALFEVPESLKVAPVVEIKPSYEVYNWRLTRRLENTWFNRRFKDTPWMYLGNDELSILDTTMTRVLRGRLEAAFGPPTRTIADDPIVTEAQIEDNIQFEYCFVVNDTIPLRVIDVGGPYDRGLVIVGDRRYRDVLRDIKNALAEEIGPNKRVDPYIDYYYDLMEKIWYRTGFDGSRYFIEEIRRPPLGLGRPSLSRRR